MELGCLRGGAREGGGATAIRLHGAGCDALHRRGRPGAEGWGQPYADANILFTEGRGLMLVGDQLAAGSDNKPVVLAAVRAVWARTHDKPGACAT